jgi:hypothetical protein
MPQYILDEYAYVSYSREGRGAMLQLYFLSVAFNLIAGYSLSSDAITRKAPRLAALGDLLALRSARLAVGLSVIVVGFITLFVPAGGGVLIIGDLIPSIVGLGMGIASLFEVFRQEAVFPSESAEKSERPHLDYRVTLGLLGMAVAILHFFLPERPFL